MTYESNAHKNEQIFLLSLDPLVAPYHRIHDVTAYD
jgi:hypothetical protein